MTSLLVHDVALDGRRVDVRCVDGLITSVEPVGGPVGADDVVQGAGGAVIPGLHDHHIHLLAADAARRSISVGPGQVADADELGRALRAGRDATSDGRWVRATGYHDSVAGPLDRWALDRLVGDHPARVQHRSGAMWILSSAACRLVDLDGGAPAGAELDDDGRPNGRLFRLDPWLRDRLPASAPPDLGLLALHLNRLGVTGVTDATPVSTVEELELLATATTLRVQATGGPRLTATEFPPGLSRGPVKIILDEHDLPSLDDLAGWFAAAHRHGRAFAVHCVTRVSLVLALAAWEAAGSLRGDRIEHGSIVPAELIGAIARLGLTVVTQPGLVAERGDEYLEEVDPGDVADLYRCGSLIERGVRVAASTDAPYSDPDPWAAMRAAISRITRSGRTLGPGERVAPERALDLFLGPLDDPAGRPRTVQVGAPADLVVLATGLDDALAAPSAHLVTTTIVRGEVSWRRA